MNLPRNANVKKIKNRYDPAYDGEETAGYRDLNLQLTLDQMDQGCVFPGFVFELQIILDCFQELKSEKGHTRYIRCRPISKLVA